MIVSRCTTQESAEVTGARSRGVTAAGAILMAVALVSTACGSTDEGIDGGGDLTGEPFDIMVNSAVDTPFGSYPGDISGARAGALDINAQGGINGRPVRITFCNNENTPAAATVCARHAVEEKFDAVVGTNGNGQVVYPTLEAANIPSSFFAVTALDLQSPANFPVSGSGWSTLVGQPFAAQAAGVKKVAIVCMTVPGQDKVCDNAEAVARERGLEVVADVEFSVSTTTFGPQVEQLRASGADGVMYFASPAQIAPLIQGANSIGYQPTWISALGIYPSAELLREVSQLTENLWVTSAFPPITAAAQFPGIEAYVSQMDAAAAAGIDDADVEDRNEPSVHAWAAVHGFAAVARTVDGDVNSANLLAAVKQARDVDVEGLVMWSPGSEPSIDAYPGLHDGGLVYYGKVDDGVYEPSVIEPVPAALGVTLN